MGAVIFNAPWGGRIVRITGTVLQEDSLLFVAFICPLCDLSEPIMILIN